MRIRLLLFFSLLTIFTTSVFAQNDFLEEAKQDTTKKIEPNKEGITLEKDTTWKYGPHTSRYLTLKDVYEIKWTEHYLDSTLHNTHRYNVRDKHDWKLQYTANNASPARYLWYQLPDDIGERIGFDAYRPHYWYQEKDIRFFNAFTPVSVWNAVIGGDRRSMIDVLFARNLTPWWDFSARLEIRSGWLLQGEDVIQSYLFDQVLNQFQMTTRYETPNQKYKLFAYYKQALHNGPETGGISIDSTLKVNVAGSVEDFEFTDLYRVLNRLENNLNQSTTRSDKREYNFQLYHQYAIADSASLQVFHKFKTSDQLLRYQDNSPNTNLDYYAPFIGVETGTEEATNFFPDTASYTYRMNYYENQAGAKGRKGDFFWAAYARHRFQKARQEHSGVYTQPVNIDGQLFVGGQLSLVPAKNDRYQINISAEKELGNNNAFQAKASVKANFLYAYAAQYNYTQDIVRKQFISPFFSWRNDFGNTESSRIYVAPRFPWKKGYVEIFGEVNLINDYTYFQQDMRPEVYNELLNYQRFGAKTDFTLWYIRQIAEVIYTNNNSQEVFRTPEFFANYQLSFEKDFKKVYLSTGFDLHWNSSYLADAFSPITQQFYLQDDQEIGNYPLLDFFFDFKIRRTNAFFKVTNILQGSFSGYFDTPNYMGQALSFEYGVKWMLFD
ncbi:putative porin [Algivirga pacifica]|uniref:Porin n=2 Tax=Algivirga pacifica TaxID=1162670 RepID=A0ABP9CYV5_9BACT